MINIITHVYTCKYMYMYLVTSCVHVLHVVASAPKMLILPVHNYMQINKSRVLWSTDRYMYIVYGYIYVLSHVTCTHVHVLYCVAQRAHPESTMCPKTIILRSFIDLNISTIIILLSYMYLHHTCTCTYTYMYTESFER